MSEISYLPALSQDETEIFPPPILPTGFHYRGDKPLSSDSIMVRYVPNEFKSSTTFQMKYQDCFFVDSDLYCHCILCGMQQKVWSSKLSLDNQNEISYANYSRHLFASHLNELTFTDYKNHTKPAATLNECEVFWNAIKEKEILNVTTMLQQYSNDCLLNTNDSSSEVS